MKTIKLITRLKLLLICLGIPAVTNGQLLKEPAIEHVNELSGIGMWFNLYVGNRMPFTDVAVQLPNKKWLNGRFLLDFGTDTTVIDLHGFPGTSVDSANNHLYTFKFINNPAYYGPYTPKITSEQALSGYGANGITESGIIGTDILSKIIVTIDYKSSRVYLNYDTTQTGIPHVMVKNGFVAVNTKGFYKNHSDNVENHNNDPTVPIVIGDGKDTARAVGWMDSGYDDRIFLTSIKSDGTYYTHLTNINKEYLEHLRDKHIGISVDQKSYYTLTSRGGRVDTLFKCIFAKKYVFNLIGIHGETVIPYSTDDCNVFLKINGPGSANNGGITTLKYPAVQFGGSFLVDCDQITFDPFRSLVWFRQKK
jgi:hypothetical protein